MTLFRLKKYNGEIYSGINHLKIKYMRETDNLHEVPGVIGYERTLPFPYYPIDPPRDHVNALHIAGKFLDVHPVYSPDEVFEKSKSLGFTQYGEMFSNEWMANLAMTIWPNVTATVSPLPDSYELVKKVFNKKVILFSYDCGYNFDPTLDKGQRAHWAVVSGFCYLSHTQWWDQEASESDAPFYDEERETFHVFAHHGKSENASFLEWEQVRRSNSQLNEVRSDKDYIVPDDGMQMKGSCVILSKDD